VPGGAALGGAARSPGAGERDPPKAALVDRIHAVARTLGVEPRLAEAVARAESNLDQSARSPDGQSVGAFQMKVPTRMEMQRRFARDGVGVSLADEVTLGVGYLDYLDGVFARRAVLDDAGRTTIAVPDRTQRRHFAIAAYNAGEGTVAAAQRAAGKAGADPRRFEHVRPYLPAITRQYVNRVLRFAAEEPKVPAPD
jgi:membrane-bound lytic murein transglycosylase MltF